MVCYWPKTACCLYRYVGMTAITVSLVAALSGFSQRDQDGDHEQFLRRWGNSSLVGKTGRPRSAEDALAFLRVADNVPELTRVGMNLGTVYCFGNAKAFGKLTKKTVRGFVECLWHILSNRRNDPGVIRDAVYGLGGLAANDEGARKRMYMLISAKNPLPGTRQSALRVYWHLRADTRELATLRRLLESGPSTKNEAALALGCQGFAAGKEAESILIEMLESSDEDEASRAWSAIDSGMFYSSKILDILVSKLDDRTGMNNNHGWAIYSLVRARKKAVPVLIAYVEGSAPHQRMGRVDPEGFIRAIVIFAAIGRTELAVPTINRLTRSRKDRIRLAAGALMASWQLP